MKKSLEVHNNKTDKYILAFITFGTPLSLKLLNINASNWLFVEQIAAFFTFYFYCLLLWVLAWRDTEYWPALQKPHNQKQAFLNLTLSFCLGWSFIYTTIIAYSPVLIAMISTCSILTLWLSLSTSLTLDESAIPTLNFKSNQLTQHFAIITGANRSIGYETALKLSQSGATVILACRNHFYGSSAAHNLNRRTDTTGTVHAFSCDLSSLSSVTKFCDDLTETFFDQDNSLSSKVLHIYCNAGTIYDGSAKNTQTRDGYELSFGVNNLGHHRILTKLLPYFSEFEKVRVVNLGSSSAFPGSFPYKILAKGSSIKSFSASKFVSSLDDGSIKEDHLFIGSNYGHAGYARSKLCAFLQTIAYNELFWKKGLRNCFAITADPGTCYSSIWPTKPALLYTSITDFLMQQLFRPCSVGARILLLASFHRDTRCWYPERSFMSAEGIVRSPPKVCLKHEKAASKFVSILDKYLSLYDSQEYIDASKTLLDSKELRQRK